MVRKLHENAAFIVRRISFDGGRPLNALAQTSSTKRTTKLSIASSSVALPRRAEADTREPRERSSASRPEIAAISPSRSVMPAVQAVFAVSVDVRKSNDLSLFDDRPVTGDWIVGANRPRRTTA